MQSPDRPLCHVHKARNRWPRAMAILAAVTLTACGSAQPTATGSRALPSKPTVAEARPLPTVISDPSTRDISVWTPATADGPWPIVYAVPGASGDRVDLDVLAQSLASHGYVVFATDHRAIQEFEDLGPATHEIECGYRHILSVAADFGGDLDAPIGMVGHSFGAGAVVYHGLRSPVVFDRPGVTFEDCATPDQRPNVIAAIAGCYYGLPGQPSEWDTSGLSNQTAHLLLIAGTADDMCPAEQSARATTTLKSIGYDVDLVEVDGADHGTLIFQEGDSGPNPDDPAGKQVAEAILAALDAARQ